MCRNSTFNFYVTEFLVIFCCLLSRTYRDPRIGTILFLLITVIFIQFLFVRYKHYIRINFSNIKRVFIIESITLFIGNNYFFIICITLLKGVTALPFSLIIPFGIFIIPSIILNKKLGG